jgi:hypothetical protein
VGPRRGGVIISRQKRRLAQGGRRRRREQGTCLWIQKWDQKAWNVYFPIIFTNHIGAIALIIVYIPYTFAVVIGFLHFLCFLVLIVLNICIKDAEPGNGSRTKGTRVVWASNLGCI